jgi:hypothetical protein
MPEITLHTEIFNDLLRLAVESGASDIVIKSINLAMSGFRAGESP